MSADRRSTSDQPEPSNEIVLEADDAIGEAREAVDDQDSDRLEAAALAQLAIARKTKQEGWD